MLTREGCGGRRRRLLASLANPCDVVVIADPAHLVYLANFQPSPFVFRTVESAAILLVEPDKSTLVADDMLGPFLESAFVEETFAPTWYDGDHAAPYRQGLLVASTLARLANGSAQRVGIELAKVPAGVVEGLRAVRPEIELLDVGPTLRRMRRSKDEDEIATIRRAIAAGEAAHAAALARVKPGMTELDVYLLVRETVERTLGAAALVYGDFASGPRTYLDKGGPPTGRVIEPGDLFLLDFSVVVDGYRSDFTNTFVVGGKPTERQAELFQACVDALLAGEAVLKAGAAAKAVDAAVRGHFASLGLDKPFVHHTGHGIGLGHPEPPYFVPRSNETLVAGDVVTLEPGLYVDGVAGIRIERNYLVTAEGYETLSNHAIALEPPA
jgi:Xaa-Pro aminopeptidase